MCVCVCASCKCNYRTWLNEVYKRKTTFNYKQVKRVQQFYRVFFILIINLEKI